jgi:hypothetical protein
VFTNDSPLNATDPLGLSISGTNGESCISLSACSNPSVQARNQGIESAASTAAFWAGVKAYLAMQASNRNAVASSQVAAQAHGNANANGMTEVPSQVAITTSNQTAACQSRATANVTKWSIVGSVAAAGGTVFEMAGVFSELPPVGLVLIAVGSVMIVGSAVVSIVESSNC